MEVSNQPKLVTVFGGSGFLGRHIVRLLAKEGYNIRVACRRPDLAGHLQPLGNVSQITAVQANLRYRDSIDRAVQGSDYVINCVGILFESGRNTFDAVQEFGARAIAEAAKANNAKLVHISAIGADKNSNSDYARTKGRAEEAVLNIVKDAVILRPSIIFGPEDGFFNKFADMSRFAPALPLIGGGHTKFQPVYVADVAAAVVKGVNGELQAGKTYELGGPEVMSFKECLQLMLKVISRKRMMVSLPWAIASLIGSITSLIPFIDPPLTPDQVELLKQDNVVSADAENADLDLQSMGIAPTALEAILPTYLVHYRPAGQYTKMNSSS
ncbi:complex I NDUFA9 subunit family protein [Lentilitoribacter sp. EG35]|uniref:complex I NDUFA9 subunit family protein n=1 Tax=Lentilitoribacter sp. EG35 TaxID=3234192 RepID=UPI00346082E6